MTTGSSTGACQLLAVFLLAGGVVLGQTQSGPSLSALTSPPETLPSGCAVSLQRPTSVPNSRDEGARTGVTSVEFTSFPTNPWIGADRKLVAEVRRAVDGTPPIPDGPPPVDAAVFHLKLADNVLEAYRAVYSSADDGEVVVWAVRFNDETLAEPQPPAGMINPARPRGFRSRWVQGATVVLVTAASSSECAQAIESYIRSLK
jgi:hypothetical protein